MKKALSQSKGLPEYPTIRNGSGEFPELGSLFKVVFMRVPFYLGT